MQPRQEGAPVILWFRQDLRLADNPALLAAAATRRPIVPVYIFEEAGRWPPGAASRWWLHESLATLARALAGLGDGGPRLVLRRGRALDVLSDLSAETGARTVYVNRRYEPDAAARDEAIRRVLGGSGVAVQSFSASLLFEPGTIATAAGTPFRIFDPFWRACTSLPPPAPPEPGPERLDSLVPGPASDSLEAWGLLPIPDWAQGLRSRWTPGEAGAAARLDAFLTEALVCYAEDRDRPGSLSTSRLSPHLHFGEIGPRQVWHAVREAAEAQGVVAAGQACLRQLGWREFCYTLLSHYPEMPDEPLRAEFAGIPWRSDAGALRAWQKGRTGYPIVDAGMRELWTSVWMHNRVRMIAASFLVKDLLLPWQAGETWFWDTLVDADLANNAANWQWVAGCGVDAAPYFRIFNPVLQGKRFDPDGSYVRRWIPELARLASEHIHAPWQAPADALGEARVRLGRDYPLPIVDHEAARVRALAAFAARGNVGGTRAK